MPNWITRNLGTSSYYDLGVEILASEVMVVDVRELVDNEGNPDSLIVNKVSLVASAVARNQQVLVCCDKGISRSNAIAFGALLSNGIPYDEVMQLFYSQGLTDINMALLHQIKRLYGEQSSGGSSKDEAVLITGGSGFIGRHLVKKLRDSTFIVYSPDRDDLNLLASLPDLDTYINKHHIRTIIHLAHPRRRNNISTIGDAICMIKNILDVCRLNDCHMHYVSSLAVFSGYTFEQPLMANVIEPLAKGVYGEAKFLCESLINNYKAVHKIRASILRPAAVYGFEQDQATFMEKFFSFAASGAEIITHEYKNGRPVFDFVYIDDLVDAIEKALTNQFTGTINIGTGVASTTFHVAELICDIMKSSSKITSQLIDAETYKIVVDPADAQVELGWSPLFTLKQGLKEIVDMKQQVKE